jgi:hypothetical protein
MANLGRFFFDNIEGSNGLKYTELIGNKSLFEKQHAPAQNYE